MAQKIAAKFNPTLSYLPDLPLVVWMIGATIAMGLSGGLNASEFIIEFNNGWGYAIGEFALILLPSFVLAAALSGQEIKAASNFAVAVSPVAGASMVCPDTAYATLSPIADKRCISVAFGSFAGFKLLYPAGPLIVATGLGVTDPFIMVFGLILLVPLWLIGAWWGKAHAKCLSSIESDTLHDKQDNSIWKVINPFILLALLLAIGGFLDLSHWPVLDFVTNAKGALILAATFGLFCVAPKKRRICIDSAVSRTGSLLLIIGAASAFGGVLTTVVPVEDFLPRESGIIGMIGLFMLTAIFKLAQGSSMATFAAVTPVAAPIVAVTSLSPIAAVFSICLGSFVAILPNDSYYWLVRNNALPDASHVNSILVLAGGATLQALAGLTILIGFSLVGMI